MTEPTDIPAVRKWLQGAEAARDALLSGAHRVAMYPTSEVITRLADELETARRRCELLEAVTGAPCETCRLDWCPDGCEHDCHARAADATLKLARVDVDPVHADDDTVPIRRRTPEDQQRYYVRKTAELIGAKAEVERELEQARARVAWQADRAAWLEGSRDGARAVIDRLEHDRNTAQARITTELEPRIHELEASHRELELTAGARLDASAQAVGELQAALTALTDAAEPYIPGPNGTPADASSAQTMAAESGLAVAWRAARGVLEGRGEVDADG